MRKTAYLSFAVAVVIISSMVIYRFTKPPVHDKKTVNLSLNREEKEEEEGGYKRRLYEWKMLHDPATGEIPRDIHKKEIALLRSIQSKQNAPGFRQTINNTYTPAGPSQNGGRTRAVAYDMRNNGVMLAAGVSGGIFRSTDGGSTWAFVHPANGVRIVSCLAQDPQTPNTWYAGTGELLGASPAYPNAFIPGFGLLKSTDNGITWSQNTFTTTGNVRESFDDIFDMIFNIQVNENGHVFMAALSSIWRSTDAGNNFSPILFETGELESTSQNIENMMTDIIISKPGVLPVRYYACFSGRNRDSDTAGVWTSTSANFGAWTRIGAPGLVTGWRAHDNNTSGGNYTAGWGRTVLSVAPGNSNILYVMYDNALNASAGQPEADLFRADLSSFPSVTWANRTSNLRALQNGSVTKYMETQDGYNMLLAVHPTNVNLVLAGGVNLFKSTDGFSTQGTFIGGLESSTYVDVDKISHVDFHSFAFHPSSTNRFVVGNDGGMQVTNDITASTITWNNLNSQYQTFQYYHVAIDPTLGSLTFSGGAQDNSTTYRDSKALLGSPLPDPNDHYVGILGGDGGMTALSPSTPTQQYLYASAQNGTAARFNLGGAGSGTLITPDAAGDGEFVTYFHLDQDNTEVLYFVSTDSIWRTPSASTVTASSGWTLMSGVHSTLTASIFSLATTRGAYNSANSYLFIGTENGKIYRLQNPRDAAAGATPVDISPVQNNATPNSAMTSQSLVREIAVNPRNPDTVLAVVSNYGAASAFWTGNATAASPTWQLVEGNLATSSFRSCAIVATTTGVEYYVGTSIGLFSTTNINGGSTNWQIEGPVMMQGAIVNDLVLRTADNTLLIGTHGNGMFYTNIGNVPTSVPDVVVNDKRFINSVFPTVISAGDINFRTGGMTGVKTINIRVTGLNGQVLMQRTQAYQNGSIPLGPVSTGSYVLEIISDNRKYKHVQQFVKTN
jgi:hypothetical protein